MYYNTSHLKVLIKALFFLLSSLLCFANGRSENGVIFNWAVLKPDAEGLIKTITTDELITLETGQDFGFYLEPLQNAFLYLYFYSKKKGLQQLFPEKYHNFTQREYYTNSYSLPADQKLWYTYSGDPGEAKLYIIASNQRLTALEKMVTDYITLASSEDNIAAQQKLPEIIRELERLLKATSQYVMRIEPPTHIAGTVRAENDLSIKKIICESLYAEIITFNAKE